MKENVMAENPYLLLTPGPLTTTSSVKEVMLKDWCTWDNDYNRIVQDIRSQLVTLGTSAEGYTSVLMQGSGSFGVEATLTTAVPENGKVLILANGAYGDRMVEIAHRCQLNLSVLEFDEVTPVQVETVEQRLKSDPDITHVAMVHCETTTGLLNPIEEVGRVANALGKIFIVDAMSSFGGIPIDMDQLRIDYLISSANKCIQGVPGFGFILVKTDLLNSTRGQARSLCLDLYDQWETMEKHQGKWRFTSPTHVVRAFFQALSELNQEGGIEERYARYCENQQKLTEGMMKLGFSPLLEKSLMSPIITSFCFPESDQFEFQTFYKLLKEKGFVIYPGKVSKAKTFRIGTIGDVHPEDIDRLLEAIQNSRYWM